MEGDDVKGDRWIKDKGEGRSSSVKRDGEVLQLGKWGIDVEWEGQL